MRQGGREGESERGEEREREGQDGEAERKAEKEAEREAEREVGTLKKRREKTCCSKNSRSCSKLQDSRSSSRISRIAASSSHSMFRSFIAFSFVLPAVCLAGVLRGRAQGMQGGSGQFLIYKKR